MSLRNTSQKKKKIDNQPKIPFVPIDNPTTANTTTTSVTTTSTSTSTPKNQGSAPISTTDMAVKPTPFNFTAMFQKK